MHTVALEHSRFVQADSIGLQLLMLQQRAFPHLNVAGVIALMFAVLIAKLLTAETVVFICMLLCWNARILTQDEALKGFSNSGMLAVGALFVVVKGVEKCQALDKLARKVFGVRSGENAALVKLCLLSFVLSAFFNNTPLVALFIPITRDWARLRGFSPSTYLM
eukprot:15927-Heterococcus_DN1.PRE.1